MLLLLDENLPIALKSLLTGHDARTVRDMRWLGLTNGALLEAIEREGFEAMITADKNIPFQQSLVARRIALVVLSTNRWRTLRDGTERILGALERARTSSYEEVTFERPPLRRRRSPERSRGR